MIAAYIAKWLKVIGKRSKAINTQLIAATLYGLLSFYGVRGTIMIIIKARRRVKDAHQRAVSRVREGSPVNR